MSSWRIKNGLCIFNSSYSFFLFCNPGGKKVISSLDTPPTALLCWKSLGIHTRQKGVNCNHQAVVNRYKNNHVKNKHYFNTIKKITIHKATESSELLSTWHLVKLTSAKLISDRAARWWPIISFRNSNFIAKKTFFFIFLSFLIRVFWMTLELN